MDAWFYPCYNYPYAAKISTAARPCSVRLVINIQSWIESAEGETSLTPRYPLNAFLELCLARIVVRTDASKRFLPIVLVVVCEI